MMPKPFIKRLLVGSLLMASVAVAQQEPMDAKPTAGENPETKPQYYGRNRNLGDITVDESQATSFTASSQENSLTPYTNASEVPQTAVDLWKDYDPRKEDLEVKTHMEWKQDGVVTRLISFKVGTFKGSDSRIAAYY